MCSPTDYYIMIVKYLFIMGRRISRTLAGGASVTIVLQDQTRVQEIQKNGFGVVSSDRMSGFQVA